MENQFCISHVSHLKLENDSPLQLNTEECTFDFSFYIFLGPLPCSRLKIFIAFCALSWKYFVLVETKSCGIFYEFKVYIFLLKVLLYWLIIFWKVRVHALYEEICSRKILPPGETPTRKITTHQTAPRKTFSRKIATQKFLTWSVPPI